MEIDEKEAEMILELAIGWMIGEGMGAGEGIDDCKFVLKLLDEYPDVNDKFGWMREFMNEQISRYDKHQQELVKEAERLEQEKLFEIELIEVEVIDDDGTNAFTFSKDKY